MGPILSSIAPVAQPAARVPVTDSSRYEVLGQIAAGGMGIVYRVRDALTGELQALKRVKLTGSARSHDLEAFELEYRVLASLDHPRIIRVFDYGVDAAGPYYTMELLEGQDLRRAAPKPFRTGCLYLRDIATSLVLLHARRLLHRDLSPSNVRLTSDGHCKLLDFGALAVFGRTQRIVGTPPAVAPEVLRGEPLDQRADLYALGALAYWLLTGRHAYPARSLAELPVHWAKPLALPSSLAHDVPPELDELVLSLLNVDPLGRPTTAAEVIARLNVIGELAPEGSRHTARLAESFFVTPRFTGRPRELHELNTAIAAAMSGQGAALRIDAVPGMGRTRLLEELAVRARTAGAKVLFADASTSRHLHGTSQTLVSRLFELLPEHAREHAVHFSSALAALGPRFEIPSTAAAPANANANANAKGTAVPEVENEASTTPRSLAELFALVSQQRPLVVAVDNLEDADAASQGLLASLASLAGRFPLLLIVADAVGRDVDSRIGMNTLRKHSRTLPLTALSNEEMLELLRSIFADAPNLERFADWLQERAAGSPLHAIEICRQLLAQNIIGYASGLWTLPAERPNAEPLADLQDALLSRMGVLSEPARSLAECLTLQRDHATLGLCVQLCAEAEDPWSRARGLLEELARADVVRVDRDGCRFSSSALRGALLAQMSQERREVCHRQLGEAFTQLADPSDLALRMEAGLHLIEGDDALRGADIIASATCDSTKLRALLANLCQAGRPVEAALKVYEKHRRSLYERLPLLAALAQCGYYESRYFGEQYGDKALDVCDALTGLATARRLQRYLGRPLALMMGVLIAYLSFVLTPRSWRMYSFYEVMQQLFATATTVVGTAALSLDAVRARQISSMLEPFGCLPERLTPVGIYQMCTAMCELPHENEVEAYATFERLLSRFSSPRYYPTLTPEGRQLCLAGLHYARGAIAVFRAHSGAALESADALDAIGFKLYSMIASQLRYLYHIARGEFALAEPHREQVELHAAHVGSVWQVETWEAAALILIHAIAIGEVVSAMRIVNRLDTLSRSVPSLKRYFRLAQGALVVVHRDKRQIQRVAASYGAEGPRCYIGWAAMQGAVARAYNQIGEFAAAKAVALRAHSQMVEADREWVALFLVIDVQLSIAEAALGDVASALARIDGLIARFADCDHPLLQGSLYEARAHICWEAKREREYAEAMAQVERWYRGTGTPTLIGKYERLATLATTTYRQVASVLPELPAPETDSSITITDQQAIKRRTRRTLG